jgi:RNA polymerase-binding transcription factor DksA
VVAGSQFGLGSAGFVAGNIRYCRDYYCLVGQDQLPEVSLVHIRPGRISRTGGITGIFHNANCGCNVDFGQGILVGFDARPTDSCLGISLYPGGDIFTFGKKNKYMSKKNPISYPEEVLRPVKDYLLRRLFGLEKRKHELVKEDPFADKARLEDNAAVDADAAERVGHMQISAVKQALERSTIQVRKALSRIKIGKYGVCERCGKMIDTDRLMIVPETTVCIDCERKREK